MTNHNPGPDFGPRHNITKYILAALGAALAVMLITSFIYRMNHPSLVKQGRAPQQNAAPEQGMSAAATGELTELMRMMQENPNDPEVLQTLAQHFMDTGDWQRAQTFLNKLVVAAPADSRPLYMLGISQYQLGQHAEAATTFERLIKLEDDPMARYNLAVLYGHFLGAPEKARPHLEAILASGTAGEELKARAKAELTGNKHEDK